ncbi:hypothetical protein MY5147_004464 [Beauveria neobassiana]
MASSNPFRRSVLQAKAADSTLPPLEPIDATQTHAAPPRTSFREPEPSDADDEPEPEPEPKAQHDRKQKPVKKVRVLTPPPLSPDSPEWPDVEPMYRTGAGLVPPPVSYDPFAGSATDESDRDGATTAPYSGVAAGAFATPPSAPGGPPGNPFSRTLQDIEDASNKEELELQQREEGEVLKAANAGTPALNVDAFKRLLLTGNSGVQDRQVPADNQGLASLNAEANKIVTSPQATQEHSEIHGDKGSLQQGQRVVSPLESSKEKKLIPPPPPSSRHGKTIKSEQPKEPEHHYVPSETKIAPHSHTPRGNESESTLDENSSNDSHANEAAAPSSSTKKSAPVPPPRRGHARSDSKSTHPPFSSSKPGEDDHEPRSSIDSTHRQDGGEKARGHIPAPPPPRRPHATPKQSGSATASSSSIPQRNAAETSPISGRSPAPPRPPARNPSSARRLPGGGSSSGGASSIDRRDSAPPPPPPPPPRPRHRGSSSPTRKSSAETPGKSSVNSSKGADILADLDALRREVEALRGAR